MFSTDPDCLLRDLDIIQARRPTDCIQFLPIPAEQLMYNPHYDPQYELTYCNGQPGTGVELSGPNLTLVAPEPDFQSQAACLSSDMPVPDHSTGCFPDGLSHLKQLRKLDDAYSFTTNSPWQRFDYGLPPLSIADQSSASHWSTPSSHTNITPLLEVTSLASSSDYSSPLSCTSSFPSPYYPTSHLFAPNPSPASSDNSLLSPVYSTHDLSPAYYPVQLPQVHQQAAFYTGGLQLDVSPSDPPGNGSYVNARYPNASHRSVTPPRLRVPQQIEAKSNDGFKVDFTIDGVPGIRLKDAVKHIDDMGLDGAFDKVFRSKGSRQIRFMLTWPGYGHKGIYIPVQDTKGHLTRAQFANLIGIRLEGYLKKLSKLKVASGFTHWRIHHTGMNFDRLWLVSVKPAAPNMWIAELEVDTT